jgi:hypothetical protein
VALTAFVVLVLRVVPRWRERRFLRSIGRGTFAETIPLGVSGCVAALGAVPRTRDFEPRKQHAKVNVRRVAISG